MAKVYGKLTSMYFNILSSQTEHHMGDPENDKQNYERLLASRSTMQTSMQLSESSVSDNTARFSKVDLGHAWLLIEWKAAMFNG